MAGAPIISGGVIVAPQTMYARVVPELQAKLRPETLILIFDPMRTGTLDPNRMAMIEQPANADIDSALVGPGGIYPTITAPFAVKLVELAMMGMEWRLGYHYQSLYPVDWVIVKQMVDADLAMIRKGQKTLGGVAPDPGANQGGSLFQPKPEGARCLRKGGTFGTGNWGGVY